MAVVVLYKFSGNDVPGLESDGADTEDIRQEDVIRPIATGAPGNRSFTSQSAPASLVESPAQVPDSEAFSIPSVASSSASSSFPESADRQEPLTLDLINSSAFSPGRAARELDNLQAQRDVFEREQSREIQTILAQQSRLLASINQQESVVSGDATLALKTRYSSLEAEKSRVISEASQVRFHYSSLEQSLRQKIMRARMTQARPEPVGPVGRYYSPDTVPEFQNN